MRINDLDYIKLVVADFKKKQRDSERPLFATFTRASIRQQCIIVLDERKSSGENIEANILQDFFGVPPNGQDMRTLIEFYPLDKFRPLENLMKGRIQNPDMAIVDLLAWLIDFKHRPFSFGKDVLLREEELAILDKKNTPENTGTPKPELQNARDGDTRSTKGKYKISSRHIVVAAGFILGVALVGAFTIWRDKEAKRGFYGNVTGCMYWAGTHYEKAPCNENRAGQLILPLNEEKMRTFMKITRPDTIREWSIGLVHYIKKNNRYEFFTTGGNHPVETTRTLRKLSQYIYDSVLCNSKKLSEVMMYSQTRSIPVTDN